MVQPLSPIWLNNYTLFLPLIKLIHRHLILGVLLVKRLGTRLDIAQHAVTNLFDGFS